MKELELYIPKLEDLWFYQKMMSDPNTMAYNAGWDVDYDGYHRDTGCIDYSDEELADWYDGLVGNEPDCFYAYIKRRFDMCVFDEAYDVMLERQDLQFVIDSARKYFTGEHTSEPIWEIMSDKPAKAVKDITDCLHKG